MWVRSYILSISANVLIRGDDVTAFQFQLGAGEIQAFQQKT